MTLAVVRSRALSGMFAPEVTVEVHLANGLPSFTLVGLPEAEVKEARERVRAALQNCRFDFPSRRITVNLAPADLPKESGRFDLPIAIGILAATGQTPSRVLERFEFAGELSLSGELRPILGTLAMTYAVSKGAADRHPPRGIIVPFDNADEASLVSAIPIFPAASSCTAFRLKEAGSAASAAATAKKASIRPKATGSPTCAGRGCGIARDIAAPPTTTSGFATPMAATTAAATASADDCAASHRNGQEACACQRRGDAVATAVGGDLRWHQFGGKAALREMRRNSLLGSLRVRLWIQEHQHGRASAAEGRAENSGFSGQFLDCWKQRAERSAVGLVDSIFECGRQQVSAIVNK